MAQTNAQRQAAFKRRRAEEFATLKRDLEEERRKHALWEELWGAYSVSDLQHLMSTIKRVRANGGKPIATAFVEAVVDVEGRIAGRQRVVDESRPEVGRVYWTWAIPEGSEDAEIVRCVVTNGKQSHVRRLSWTLAGKAFSQPMKHECRGRWGVSAFHHSILLDTEEEARASLRAAERGASEALGRILRQKRHPTLEGLSDHELRLVRSRNHPDRNADADTALFQAAVEELDRRRMTT